MFANSLENCGRFVGRHEIRRCMNEPNENWGRERTGDTDFTEERRERETRRKGEQGTQTSRRKDGGVGSPFDSVSQPPVDVDLGRSALIPVANRRGAANSVDLNRPAALEIARPAQGMRVTREVRCGKRIRKPGLEGLNRPRPAVGVDPAPADRRGGPATISARCPAAPGSEAVPAG